MWYGYAGLSDNRGKRPATGGSTCSRPYGKVSLFHEGPLSRSGSTGIGGGGILPRTEEREPGEYLSGI